MDETEQLILNLRSDVEHLRTENEFLRRQLSGGGSSPTGSIVGVVKELTQGDSVPRSVPVCETNLSLPFDGFFAKSALFLPTVTAMPTSLLERYRCCKERLK